MHFGASANWTVREYALATYLIVATPWSFYGMSNGWGAASFPRYPEYDRPLGAPLGDATVSADGTMLSRRFASGTVVQVNTSTTPTWSGSITWAA